MSETVFNLGNFKGDHFHLISSENKNTVQYVPIHIMLKVHG